MLELVFKWYSKKWRSRLKLSIQNMVDPKLQKVIENWQLPHKADSKSCLPAIEKLVSPAITKGFFGSSPTLLVSGLQYHLSGKTDTEELAKLANISPDEHILDVCCFLGGPAIQLAESFGCRVTGVDISENCIAAAKKLVTLCSLKNLVNFYVADAESLPFKDSQFSVVWSQGSLKHARTWLQEFDRVLKYRGQLALTFATRGENPDKNSPKWSLKDIKEIIKSLGYSIKHVEDITERDIKTGWKALTKKLKKDEGNYVKILGKAWVQKAYQKFENEIQQMRTGVWGNGRIVATKTKKAQ